MFMHVMFMLEKNPYFQMEFFVYQTKLQHDSSNCIYCQNYGSMINAVSIICQ